jgi:hypothetical protein
VRPVRRILWPLRSIAGVLRSTRRTIAAVPDLVDAILVLPTLSRQLEAVTFSTATLPEMLAEIQRVHGDTSNLPVIGEEIHRMSFAVAQVETNTLSVQQLADVAVPLQRAAFRLGRFADRLPRRPLAR